MRKKRGEKVAHQVHVGDRFGRWTVLRRGRTLNNGHVMAVCVCVCGSECEIRVCTLRSGHSTSCGCYRAEAVSKRMQKVERTAFAETKSLVEWSRDARCIVSYNTLRGRLGRGMSIVDAMTQPKMNCGRKPKKTL